MKEQTNKLGNPYGLGPQFFDPKPSGPYFVQGGPVWKAAPAPRGGSSTSGTSAIKQGRSGAAGQNGTQRGAGASISRPSGSSPRDIVEELENRSPGAGVKYWNSDKDLTKALGTLNTRRVNGVTVYELNGKPIGYNGLWRHDPGVKMLANMPEKRKPASPSAEPSIRAWEPSSGSRPRVEPSYGRKIAKKIVPYVRPVLETGGTLAGGLLGGGFGLATGPGAIATSPMGAFVGAGLGRVWGSSLANLFEEYAGTRQALGPMAATWEAGGKFLEGASDHAGGEIAGAVLAPVARGLATKAPRFNKQATRVFPDLNQNPVVDVGSGYAKDKARAAFEKHLEERRRETARRGARAAGR